MAVPRYGYRVLSSRGLSTYRHSDKLTPVVPSQHGMSYWNSLIVEGIL